MRTALIDGDVLVYRFANGCQEMRKLPERQVWVMYAREDKARVELANFIDHIKEKVEADRALVVLSDPDANFRKDVYSDYKFSRMAVARPMLWGILRDVLFEEYGAYMWPRLEGDDVLGILGTEDLDARRLFGTTVPGNDERIICSTDKDMATVPGWHFNWDKEDEGIKVVTPTEAYRNHLTQTLTGDQTDGYKGCPRIGPVAAGRLFDKFGVHWQVVVDAFKKAELSEEVALMNARCAYILQSGDYDKDTGEVKLWAPEEARECIADIERRLQ